MIDVDFDDLDTRIVLYVTTHTRSTVRDIGRHIGRSIGVTHERLVRLRAAGVIDWVDGKSATIHTLVRPVPVIGKR